MMLVQLTKAVDAVSRLTCLAENIFFVTLECFVFSVVRWFYDACAATQGGRRFVKISMLGGKYFL